MICLLGILFLAAAAFAQPVEGPWEVWQNESGREMIQVDLVMSATDTVGLFFTDRVNNGNYHVYSATWLMQSHNLLSNPDTLRAAPEWRYALNDAMPYGDGTWLCTMTGDSGYWYGSGHNDAVLIHGSPQVSILHQRLLYAGTTDPIGLCWGDCSRMTDCHLSPRVGGGFMLAAAVSAFFDIPTREYDASPWIYAFGNPAAAPDWQMELWLSTLFGCPNNFVASLSPDTTLILAEGDIWPDVFFGRICSQCDIDSNPPVELECAPDVREFMRTENGRTIALSGTPYDGVGQVYELHESGECTLTYTVSSGNDFVASANNPGWGFAALFVGSSSIELVRIDTSAAEAQPLGTFYWRDDEHTIVSGNLTIADDGRVIVVWTERETASPFATRLRLGTVGWATPLSATPQPEVVASPRNFGLSCYPNPFNSTVTIRYDLPSAADITVSIFNLLGEEIAVLQNGRQSAGAHSVTWRPEVGSGIYFVRMEAGSTREMRKIIYLK